MEPNGYTMSYVMNVKALQRQRCRLLYLCWQVLAYIVAQHGLSVCHIRAPCQLCWLEGDSIWQILSYGHTLYFFMFNFFIVLLLLLCRVCYCDACKCLYGLGICVWFYPNW